MSIGRDDLERRALTLLENALDRPTPERAGWVDRKTEGDPELRRRVNGLLAREASDGTLIATGGAPGDTIETDMPERIGAYRVVEQLGQGGMGAVYRAERETGDFDHVVAIKLIRPGALSSALIERFQRERQTLARLSHPNIAWLFDGGTTSDGEPFIVMEYVDGVPIDQWADKKALDFHGRLRLFLTVCGAVRFAHQNLIIHRDLTPANVLVMDDGTVKLIDFGIARAPEPMTAGEPVTAPVEALSLTPGFAAPERMTGAPASTLVDIFSLGRLLDVLVGLCADDRDLAAIIARAADPDAERRYPSVDALIDDLERYQRGYPVEARHGGGSYALGKFLRRNIRPVLVAATVLLLLLGAFGLTVRAYSETEASRAEADRRFNQVRGLATTLMFDVYDSVATVPGTTAAKEKLASTAQTYLDALAGDPDAPFDVRLEAGRGYKRLGDVLGGTGGGSLGQRDAAMANYARADAILSALHAEAPASEAAALALAELRARQSRAAVHFDDDMETGLRYARDVARILPRDCADRDACALARASAALAEGESLHWLERLKEAVTAFDRGLGELEAVAPEASAGEEGVRLLARAHRLKGDTLYYLDDVEGSVRELGLASAILKLGIANGIGGPAIKRDLAIVEWSRGGSLDEFGKAEEGVEALNLAYRLMEEQVAADPEDKGSLRLLAVVGGQRALTLSSAGRHDEAVKGALAGLAIRRRLFAAQPDESGFFRDVAIQLQALGDIHRRAGNEREACLYYRETVEQFDALDARWGMAEFDRDDTYARTRTALADC